MTETGHGEEVYAQVKALLEDPDAAPQPLCEDLQRFSALLIRNGRMPEVKRIFRSFIRLYDERHDIHLAHLKTAVDSPALQARLEAFVRDKIGGRVDPALIGGFVLEVDDYRLDASVSHQLEDIRRQLIEKNKRIV